MCLVGLKKLVSKGREQEKPAHTSSLPDFTTSEGMVDSGFSIDSSAASVLLSPSPLVSGGDSPSPLVAPDCPFTAWSEDPRNAIVLAFWLAGFEEVGTCFSLRYSSSITKT